MGKEPEAPIVITAEKKSGKSPVLWGVLAAVVIFPVSLLTAIPLSLAARKGFARANLVYLTVLLAVITAFLYLTATEPLTGYVDAVKSLVNLTDLLDLGTDLTPNLPLFVSAGLTVGCLLATIYAVAWRASHKNDEDWVEDHPERLDALSTMVVNRRNKKVAAENEKVIDKIAEGEWFGPHEVGLGYVLESVEPGRKIEPVGLPDLVGGSVNHSLILGSSGRGKQLACDTPIPTPSGWTTMGELSVGDVVFGADGQPTVVTLVSDIDPSPDLYEVVFSDGSTISADADHLWYTETIASRGSESRDRTNTRARRSLLSEDALNQARTRLGDVPEGDLRGLPDIAALLGVSTKAVPGWLRDIAAEGGPEGVERRYKGYQNSYYDINLYDTHKVLTAGIAHASGIWNDQRSKRSVGGVRTTSEIRDTLTAYGKTNHSISVANALVLPDADLPIEPYLLGVWLGDGFSNEGLFCGVDTEIAEEIERAGAVVIERPLTRIRGAKYDGNYHEWRVEGLRVSLRKQGLLRNKHVPSVYLRGSVSQRTALLAGLLDTDGTVSPDGRTQFDNTNLSLATAVRELALSLGMRATITSKTARLNGKDCGLVYRVNFKSADPIFRLPRKIRAHSERAGNHSDVRNERRFIVAVNRVRSRPARCIQVDNQDHLFLASEAFIPTHNTQTITRQAFDAIKNGTPVLVVDAKGDGDLAAKVGAYAEEFGRPFYHFSIPSSTSAPYVGPSERGRAFYDPAGLSAGNHTRRRDFMMNARDWTGAPAVYSDKTRDWLSRALWIDNVVAECNGGRPLASAPQATFSRIADFMSPMSAKHYLRDGANQFGVDAINAALGTTTYDLMMAELEEYATMKDQTGESARMSHAAWLRTFMSSVTGPYLRDTGDSRTIDIARIVREQAVCVFDLATDQYREEAPAIARLVIADLLTYISNAGKADGMRLRVFLDEFAAVGGEESANVLARARSAGVSFTLSTQTLSDLREVSDAFEGQVLTNSLNLLIHNASTWDEAERLAGMTGQVDAQRITKSARMDGGGDGARTKSVTTERRYRVEASEFMEMGVGELVKVSQVERGAEKAVKVAVVMPPRVHGSIYTVDGASNPVPEPVNVAEVVEESVAETVPAPESVEAERDVESEPTLVAVPTHVEQSLSPATDDDDEAWASGNRVQPAEYAVDDKSDEEAAPVAEADGEDEGRDPMMFVTESEDDRRARIAALAASGPLFDPAPIPVVETPSVEEAPVAEEEDASLPTRPQRPVRRSPE